MRIFGLLLVVVLNSGFAALGADGPLAIPASRLEGVNPAIPTSGASSMPKVQIPARSVRSTIHGMITWVDEDRKLVVLQDGSNAMVFRLDLPRIDLVPGEQVVLEGQISPSVAAFPDYPDKPTGSEIYPSFEGPTNWAEYYLTRMRGFLRPPVTGRYRFWIASDDASELWLSENLNPANAKLVASVGYSTWTEPREWGKFPSQQSKEYKLEAGTDYYIEAIAYNGWGKDCLAVAWQGPGFDRSVIDGRYLSPWRQDDGITPDARGSNKNGILREYWNNFFLADLSVLRSPDPFMLNLQRSRIVERQNGQLPTPTRIRVGQILNPGENYHWVEVEGRVNFSARSDKHLDLELMEGQARISVHVVGVAAEHCVFPDQSLLRVRGVCEAVLDTNSQLRAGILWVNTATNVLWLDSEENWSQFESLPIHLLTASNAGLAVGQLIRARGRVVRQESPGLWRIQGNDVFEGYVSSDGTNWNPIGPPVEFAMSNSVLAGLAVASHSTDELAEVQFDHIRGLSGLWLGTNIGGPARAGSFDLNGTAGTVRGCGEDIWSGSDQFFFAYQMLEGEGEIVARLAGLTSADPLAKAGVMIREAPASTSTWAGMLVMPTHRMGLQARRETGRNTAGALSSQPGDWLKLTRHRSSFLMRAGNREEFSSGQMLDVLGTLAWEKETPVLTEARYRGIAESVSNSRSPASHSPAPPALRDVLIRNMSAQEEAARLAGSLARFRIRGVVTFNDQVAGEPLLFVQDVSGGCLVRLRAGAIRKAIKAGEMVEMTGASILTNGVSEFAASGIASIGMGSPPQPMAYPFTAADNGPPDGQWIEIKGVGRSVNQNGALLVMTKGGLLPVWAGKAAAGRLARYVNARVRIRGVFWRTTAPMLLISSESFIEVEEPPPEDPFDIPVFAIDALRALNVEPESARQIKVAGVVTCRRDEFFLVQDQSGGVRVDTRAPANVEVGDAVEVVGFPEGEPPNPVLSEAVVNRIGPGKLPPSVTLLLDDVVDERNNNRVVRLEAVLLEQRRWKGMQFLDLQVGQRAFRAVLPVNAGPLLAIAVGSRIQVTGVSQIERAESSPGEGIRGEKPLVASLELFLRQPADVVVLQPPPWWNWKYTAGIIGFSVLGLAGSVIWIRTLRRRVEERTRELRETMGKLQKETQISATLAERDRLAGEIHDSLEQGLSAIMMQTDAAVKQMHQPEEVSRFLAVIKNMAGFSRAEVQHAVWDMQSPLLENADLGTALRRIAREISVGDLPKVTVEICGPACALPSTVEHHLLRIGQEAITNAVKHGQPKTIQLTLNYGTNGVTLTVHDDGCGFDPNTVAVGNGHFGLQGLRTRARKINAALTVSSKPNQGATIEVVLSRDAVGSPGNPPLRNS